MRFDHLVEQYTTYLLKISYLNVRDQQVAEDIVQEVFIKLYEKFGDIIALDNPKAYLVTMTMNRCKDYFKSWHYRKIQLTQFFGKEEHDNHTKPQDELIHSIQQLAIAYREVIILYYYDEQTTTEIARTLNIPIGTVKARLQRGRLLLKDILDQEEEEGNVHAQKN